VPDFEIKLTGVDVVLAKLDKVGAASWMRAPMAASLIELETYMKHYPPPPDAIQGPAIIPVRSFKTKGGGTVRLRANKASGKGISLQEASSLRYVRTGKLGQSWTITVRNTQAELLGKVGTNLKYAPYVQSAALQARVHEGRWHTDVEAANKFRDKIIARFRNAVVEVTR